MIPGTLIWQTNNRDKWVFQSVYPASWQNISAAWREQHDRECFSKMSCLYFLTASIHLKKTKRRLVSVISKYKTAQSELKTEPGLSFLPHSFKDNTQIVGLEFAFLSVSRKWKHPWGQRLETTFKYKFNTLQLATEVYLFHTNCPSYCSLIIAPLVEQFIGSIRTT